MPWHFVILYLEVNLHGVNCYVATLRNDWTYKCELNGFHLYSLNESWYKGRLNIWDLFSYGFMEVHCRQIIE